MDRWHADLISINLTPRDLDRPGYEQWLLAEVAAAGLAPDQITVEIVESSLVEDSLEVAGRLARLRAAGIRIAIDDFGTGYSSLAYLASLPLDAIKIDRAMIADIVGGSRDRIIVKAMISLARELGLQVIVEGVEDLAQLRLLEEWGCDLYQGFLGAAPLDEAELARFVTASSRARPGPLQLLFRPPPAPASARARFAARRSACPSPVGQSRLITSLLSGRSLAAPFSRST